MSEPERAHASGPVTGAGGGSVGRLLGAVLVRPGLWLTALAVLVRLARPGWWRRWPPLPRADPAYWRFRMETVYGGDGRGRPSNADALAYLRWCRRTPGARG